jgi:hypothetical protein
VESKKYKVVAKYIHIWSGLLFEKMAQGSYLEASLPPLSLENY